MFKPTLMTLKVFLFSFAICLMVCFIAVLPIFISSNDRVATVDTNYASAPYKAVSTSVIVSLKDAPVDFLLEIGTAFGCRVTCFAKMMVKNSTEELPPDATQYEKARFWGKSAKHKILADTDTVARVVNKLGGITCDTPYGLTSPAGGDNTIALDETLHFYGSSVAEMLLAEDTPSYEMMCFYAKLIGLITSSFLTAANTENYILLNSITETDISYKDYYDNYQAFVSTANPVTAYAPKGVWINNKYYIY